MRDELGRLAAGAALVCLDRAYSLASRALQFVGKMGLVNLASAELASLLLPIGAWQPLGEGRAREAHRASMDPPVLLQLPQSLSARRPLATEAEEECRWGPMLCSIPMSIRVRVCTLVFD